MPQTPTTPFRHVYDPEYVRFLEEEEAKRRARQGPTLPETASRAFSPGALLGAGPADPVTYRDPLLGQERGVGGRVSQPSEDFLAMQKANDQRLLSARPDEPPPEPQGEYRLPRPPPEPTPATPDERRDLSQLLTPPVESSPAPPLAEPEPPGPRVGQIGEMPGPPPGDPTQYLSRRGQGMEDLIEDVPRRERLEKMQGLAAITEGLNLAGRSAVGLSGAPIPQMDDTAMDLRMEAARIEDEVTPAESRAARAYGLELTPGMRRSQVRELGLMPAMTALRGAESRERVAGARTTQEWLKWAMDRETRETKERTRVAERKEDQEIRARERAQDMEIAEKKHGRLSDKEIAEVAQIDDAIQGMKHILKERQQKGYATGFLDKMSVKAGEFMGVGLSKESLQWRGKVRLQLATWIRDMAGAALGPKEAELYLDAMPTEWDNEPAFDAKLTSVVDGLEKKRLGFLDTRNWAGKETGPFEIVRYKDPKRGVFKIPRAESAEFEADPVNAAAVRQPR